MRLPAKEFLKIEPGKSILQFYDVVDGRFVHERHKSYAAGHFGRIWSLMRSSWAAKARSIRAAGEGGERCQCHSGFLESSSM